MSEQAYCAHTTVKWRIKNLPDGLTTGWWECQDCHTKFIPEAAIAALRAELERVKGEKAILRQRLDEETAALKLAHEQWLSVRAEREMATQRAERAEAACAEMLEFVRYISESSLNSWAVASIHETARKLATEPNPVSRFMRQIAAGERLAKYADHVRTCMVYSPVRREGMEVCDCGYIGVKSAWQESRRQP